MIENLIWKRDDGSYVATVQGYPYHVTQADMLWSEAHAMAQSMGAELQTEPALPQPTPEQSLAAERGRMALTRLQFALQALSDGVMTAAETEAFLGPRAVPQIGEDALLLIEDAGLRMVARMRLVGFERLERNDPFLVPLRAAVQWTDARVDDFFRAGMLL